PEERSEVDEAGVGAVDLGRLLLREVESLDHVEHEERAHSVVAEALPHLGEEEDVETFGMRFEGGRGGSGHRRRTLPDFPRDGLFTARFGYTPPLAKGGGSMFTLRSFVEGRWVEGQG